MTTHLSNCDCDSCLLTQMRSSDAVARQRGWEAWYERDGAILLAYLLRRCHLLGCPDQSEDLVQDTFIAGFRNISCGHYVEQGSPLRAYLYGIARNLLRGVEWLCRKESVLPDDKEAELVATTPAPIDHVVVEQVLMLVKEAYERQPLLAQHVIEGIYAYRKSSNEVAQQVNNTAGGVRNIAYRAVNDMQRYLAQKHDLHISSITIRYCLEELSSFAN